MHNLHHEISNTRPALIERIVIRIRNHTINLVNAINRRNYEAAWVTGLELQRSLDVAAYIVDMATSDDGRTFARSRLNDVRSVALHVLTFAPALSEAAVSQLKSVMCGSDPARWRAEEAHWLAQRATQAPLVLSTRAGTLVLRGAASR